MTLPSSTTLRIQHISKQYGRSSGHALVALEDISCEVSAGEWVCLVGPSGCGKSTLLHIIASLDRSTSGSIEVHGSIGFMFQEPTLFPWLNVQENVGFGLRMQKVDANVISQKTDTYLKMVGLSEYKPAYPHQLSGGMKQRAALARMLILDPDILLMDEPFGSLDTQTKEQLHEDLERIWRETKKTIVFVTHDVYEAVRLGDIIHVFSSHPGRIKTTIPVDLPRPRSSTEERFLRLAQQVRNELDNEPHDRV